MYFKKFKSAFPVTHLHLILFYALISTLLLNRYLLQYVFNLPIPENLHNLIFQASIGLLVVVIQVLLCLPFLLIGATKPAIVAFSFIAFITSYFSMGYGIIFDSTVTESVFVTNYSEISQYFNLHLFLNLSLIIFLSLATFAVVRVISANFRSRCVLAFKLMASCIVVIATQGFVFYKDYAGFFRNNRQVRHMVNPLSPIYEVGKHVINHTFPKQYTFTTIGEDARHKKTNREKVVILVLGETARSDHFSLNGYNHNETNPLLSKEDVISLKNFTSCGTATATSVPCIFSNLGRAAFDPDTSDQRGNLLDVAKQAGYQVTWIDNNTGCQGVCRRTGEIDISKLVAKDYCNGKTCYDEILLRALSQVKNTTQPQLIVLHMLGSHGPSYHLRYPKDFNKFQPSCDTSELSACSKEQVTNSYDNTILYTDYILKKVIDHLKGLRGVDSAMFYVSDHGESLGENGIYLHSLPYFLAPKAQKHVPAILWFSDSFLTPEQTRIVKQPSWTNCEFSHDVIFPTLINLLDIETKEYQKQNDVFAALKGVCTTPIVFESRQPHKTVD